MKKKIFSIIILVVFLMTNVLPVSAASVDQQIIPIKSYSPSGTGVRPDSPIILNLDTEDPNWPRMENQFQIGNFSVTLNDREIPAFYDPVTASITAYPGTLTRYTKYSLNLLIKSNLHNNSGNVKPSLNVPIDFQTGSGIGEPSKARLVIDNPNPRVTEKATVTLEITDDYGNPATIPADIAIQVKEAGTRLLQSSNVTNQDITTITGSQTFEITDKEAEAVTFTANIKGIDQVISLSGIINFRPGLPANFNFDYPKVIEAGALATLNGTITDVYGNLVENGEAAKLTLPWNNESYLQFSSGGQVSFDYFAPTTIGNYDLIFNSAGQEVKLPFTVIPAAPATLELTKILPANAVDNMVPADGTSAAKITAIVKDIYGNPVMGTVDFTNTLGQLSSKSVVLSSGAASVNLTSLVEGISTVTAKIGNLTKSIDITFTNPKKPVELGPIVNLPGTATHIGFTVNTDGKFWISKGRSNAIFTSIINPDGTAYKTDLKNPPRTYVSGYRVYTVDADTLPTIHAMGNGKVMMLWSRFYNGQYYLMGNQYSASGAVGANNYMLGGDNRDAYLTILNGVMNMVWSENVNQGYTTFKILGGTAVVDYDGRVWGGSELTIADNGKNYDPAVAFANDTSKTRWTFYTKSNYPNTNLLYSVNTLLYDTPIFSKKDVILETNGSSQPTAISYNKEIVVAYKKANDIVVRRINDQGVVGNATVVAQGSCPILAKDTTGQVWIAWIGADSTVNYAPLTLN